eukprot:c15636_g1_i1.p1 GENE.c15636_g1_i1~~c15636_g1_i1.p1  ORF type:complete len:243 (+),score=46.19 c15636_g1_i1:23-751(+)
MSDEAAILKRYAYTRNSKHVIKACSRLLAGLQHIVDWKLSYKSQNDNFKYTIGGLIQSIESTTEENRYMIISYFCVFIESVSQGEKIKFQSNSCLSKAFRGQMKYEKRITLCRELLDFVSSSLILCRKEHPAADGPFPRLSSMEMPIYEIQSASKFQTSVLRNESKNGTVVFSVGLENVSHEKKQAVVMESSKVLVLIIFWLHGRVLASSKKLWVTDRKFNAEIHELTSVMARWTQVGRSFH